MKKHTVGTNLAGLQNALSGSCSAYLHHNRHHGNMKGAVWGHDPLRKNIMDSAQQRDCLRSCEIPVISRERHMPLFPIKEKKDN